MWMQKKKKKKEKKDESHKDRRIVKSSKNITSLSISFVSTALHLPVQLCAQRCPWHCPLRTRAGVLAW